MLDKGILIKKTNKLVWKISNQQQSYLTKNCISLFWYCIFLVNSHLCHSFSLGKFLCQHRLNYSFCYLWNCCISNCHWRRYLFIGEGKIELYWMEVLTCKTSTNYCNCIQAVCHKHRTKTSTVETWPLALP